VYAPRAELPSLAPADPFGETLAIDLGGSPAYSYYVERTLADGGSKTVFEPATAATKISGGFFIDDTAAIGIPYLYTIRGFDPAAGYTKAVTLPSYLSPWTEETLPSAVGGSAQRLYPDSGGGFYSFAGTTMSRWSAAGGLLSAFEVGAVGDDDGNILSPVERLAAADGSTSSWMIVRNEPLTNEDPLVRLDPDGVPDALPLATFGNLGSSFNSIREMVGGKYLYADWQGSKGFVAYDATGEVASLAERPAGTLGSGSTDSKFASALGAAATDSSLEGALLVANVEYSYADDGTLSLGAASITPYSVAESNLSVGEPVALSIGKLTSLARIPAGFEGSSYLNKSNCYLLAHRPWFDAQGHYWIGFEGHREYQVPLSNGFDLLYPSFSFIVEFDQDGAMLGFMGGSEEDYPGLGAWPLDVAVDSEGKLLVLRDGLVTRYSERSER